MKQQLLLWNLCVNPHLLIESNLVDFSFCKRKESRCVDHVKTMICAKNFIFCYLQPTSSFYYLLEPSVVNHHSFIESSFVLAMCKHGKHLDLLSTKAFVHLEKLAF